MLQTTNELNQNKTQSTHTENQDVPGAADETDGGKVGRSIKILSTAAKSAKSKKPKLTKPKKSDLVKTQNFAKANSSGTDFLTPKARKAFIHLWKAFI